MFVGTINDTDFISRFTALKQSRFSGQLLLKAPVGQSGIFYLYFEMDKFWGMKQGADAYLAKPVDQEQLLQTVKQLIKG